MRALPPLPAPPGEARPIRPRLRRDPVALQTWKDSLGHRSVAGSPTPNMIEDLRAGTLSPTPRAVLVGSTFAGPSNADNVTQIGFGVLPPDSNIGAGPNHLFQIVNSVGRISDKAGTVLASFTLRSFFQLDPSTEETDPRVLFDAGSQRWFATYAQSGTTTSSIVLAVSTSSDPTGSFCRYRLGNPTVETFLQDFPQIGVSDDKVVVAYDAFSFSGFVLGAGYYVLNKADLIGCVSPRLTRVPPDPSRFTEFPAQSLSSTSALFLAMNNGSSLSLFTITGVPGGAPVVETSTILPIRPWSVPPNAPQLGSAVPLDTGDESVLSASWRANSLWLAGNEACVPPGDVTSRSCLRVLEVRTDGPSVSQDMTFGAAGSYYYYPALAPDAAGNVPIVFTSSSAGEFASVRITGRYSGAPVNTLAASTLVRAGSGAQTDPSGRMGDYSGAAVDPADPLSVWTMGEYIQSAGPANWATYVGRLRFDSPTLVAAVLPASRSVQVGATATAFASIINAGASKASGVGIALNASIPAIFGYQTTDPATNVVTGAPNTPVDILPGASQSYVIAVTPTGAFAPLDVPFVFTGSNTAPAALLTGVNTLLLSASPGPVADMVALAATVGNTGIVNVPGPTGQAAFAVATVNLGAGASITASADTGDAALPLTLSLCQTNPATGQCISAIGPTVPTQVGAGATPTFGIFVTGTGTVPFDAARSRIFVRFKDGGGVTRGATSVAVRTQ